MFRARFAPITARPVKPIWLWSFIPTCWRSRDLRVARGGPPKLDAMSNAGDGRRIAIIGAGPSGFYAAEQLLGQGFEVDLLDLLPTPFGLVRAGVAPDHPKIKSVTRMYEKTARKDGFGSSAGCRSARTCAAPSCWIATTRCSTRSGPARTT